jgi:acetolactate synthase-1/2/3 large subunit
MRHANEGRLVERFAARLGAAVFATASGRGSVDESLDLFGGLAGLYTPERAARLWAETDLVVALGSRLEETATFQWPQTLGTDIPVVQVNTEAADFAPDFGGPKVLGDARAVLRAWHLHLGQDEARNEEWTTTVRAVHAQLRTAAAAELGDLAAAPQLHIAEVLRALDEVVPANRILVQENGLQDMWSYRFPLYACAGGGGSIVPSEQTSLGFGAAAAVGVKAAAPDRPVVAFVGDGAFNLFDADLLTALDQAALGRDRGLLYVVLDNGGYGWLQSQLDQREHRLPGYGFVSPGVIAERTPHLPGLRRLTVGGKETLLDDIGRAWKWAAAGDVVVLNVPARLDDAMFGAEVAGGDFPVLPQPAAAQAGPAAVAERPAAHGKDGRDGDTV